MARNWILGVALGSLLAGSGTTFAADADHDFAPPAASPVNRARPEPRDDSWYYQPQPSAEPTVNKPTPRQIVQQRAMAHGQQRSDRLAAMAWYGMYNSRPTAAATPYTTPLYSPAWESPYRAGFSWRQGTPTYVISGRPSYLVR